MSRTLGASARGRISSSWHCIPIDPFYLAWAARAHPTRFVELAGEITAMPAYVVRKIVDALAARGRPIRGGQILLLGMAYKPDVGDPRQSCRRGSRSSNYC